MKLFYLTAITLLPIVTTDVAFASDISHLHPHGSFRSIGLFNASDDASDVRQGVPRRRISGSSRAH